QLARIRATVSDAQYRGLRSAGVFQDLAWESGLGNSIWTTGTGSEVIWQMITSPNFFDLLGVGASAGRLYVQSDDGRAVAVVSHGFWRKRLRADRSAVGQALQLDGKLYTVVGVLPRDYRSVMGHGLSPELYLIGHPGPRGCRPFGRLRDGLTRAQT